MLKVTRGRNGWSGEEDALLFEEIQRTRSSGKPLKAVFETVAERTGRRPNSIRNYYYARIREQDLCSSALHPGAFVPFAEDEIRSLLRTVLSAQANGISVRSCTMSMGGGDTRAMLRYQNKYRALLKNRPELVMEVAEELRREGVDFDPYANRRERGAERSTPLSEKLGRISGMDGRALAKGLERMAELAAAASAKDEDTAALSAAVRVLRERVERQEAELREEQRRFHELLTMYRSLAAGSGARQELAAGKQE